MTNYKGTVEERIVVVSFILTRNFATKTEKQQQKVMEQVEVAKVLIPTLENVDLEKEIYGKNWETREDLNAMQKRVMNIIFSQEGANTFKDTLAEAVK